MENFEEKPTFLQLHFYNSSSKKSTSWSNFMGIKSQ